MSAHLAELPGAHRKLMSAPQTKKVIIKNVNVHKATATIRKIVTMWKAPRILVQKIRR